VRICGEIFIPLLTINDVHDSQIIISEANGFPIRNTPRAHINTSDSLIVILMMVNQMIMTR